MGCSVRLKLCVFSHISSEIRLRPLRVVRARSALRLNDFDGASHEKMELSYLISPMEPWDEITGALSGPPLFYLV